MSSHILVVDDDPHIREVIQYALSSAGMTVHTAANGAEALAAFARSTPALIVLDIVMPEEDGFAVCRAVRAKGHVPIVFVSSKDEELDRILGLELGGDDYLTKPFSPRELVARVKAVLRRSQVQASPPVGDSAVLTHGALAVDSARHQCRWHRIPFVLTVTEFTILHTLISAPGRVFTRSQLVQQAFGDGYAVTERTVDSHVRRIRHKLRSAAKSGEDILETVYGVGYRLREVPPDG